MSGTSSLFSDSRVVRGKPDFAGLATVDPSGSVLETAVCLPTLMLSIRATPALVYSNYAKIPSHHLKKLTQF